MLYAYSSKNIGALLNQFNMSRMQVRYQGMAHMYQEITSKNRRICLCLCEYCYFQGCTESRLEDHVKGSRLKAEKLILLLLLLSFWT